jgi:hypothetical protein
MKNTSVKTPGQVGKQWTTSTFNNVSIHPMSNYTGLLEAMVKLFTWIIWHMGMAVSRSPSLLYRLDRKIARGMRRLHVPYLYIKGYP